MTMAPRRLSDLLAGIAVADSARDIVVGGLTLDSRRVRSGDAFIALRGGTTHGITFAPAALALGGSVMLPEAPAPAAYGAGARDEGRGTREEPTLRSVGTLPGDPRPSPLAPVLWIEGLRAQVGEIASRFFGRPSEALRVIGVTGTNGK